MSIYDFILTDNAGNKVPMENFRGKVLLILNTATRCGFSYQLEILQKLYERLGNEKFEILAFPSNQFANQEPGTDEEIKEIMQSKYGVKFPIFTKLDVNGDNANPLFQFLKAAKPGLFDSDIKWNFTKFLVDAEGNVVGRYTPKKNPNKLETIIKGLMEKE
ncbi:MAG: glutathione peroxidase [Clostridia bacterium]